MDNILVIINSHDIPPALLIAATLPSYKTYTFDPGLVDKLIDEEFQNVEFVCWNQNPEYNRLTKLAHTLAWKTERELDNAVRELTPGFSMFAWQHLNFYYLFIASLWYRPLWNDMMDKFADSKPYIFICDNPSNYYWPSFVPSLALLETLKGKGIDFAAYHYGVRPDETDAVPGLFGCDAPDEKWDVLTHLPTCFYDHPYFCEELIGAKKSFMHIQSKYWDVPVVADKAVQIARITDLESIFPAEIVYAINGFCDIIEQRLETLLEPHIRTVSYRARQIQHHVSMYRSQYVSYLLLNAYFLHNKPGKILISDHDAGFHGPIISFSNRYNIPVLLVPHSKATPNLEIDCKNLISLTHPSQGEDIHNHEGKRAVSFKLAYPELFAATTAYPRPLRKVGLLLNSTSLDGVLVSGYTPYLNGVLKLIAWCRQRDMELTIRCRPGHTLFNILSTEAGIPIGELQASVVCSMWQFAENLDLCIMFDTPTTGAIDFLRHSIPIVNPIVDELAKYEACMVPTDLIPRGSVESTIELLDSFVSDETSFFTFRTTQFCDYVKLFNGAQPLRAFL